MELQSELEWLGQMLARGLVIKLLGFSGTAENPSPGPYCHRHPSTAFLAENPDHIVAGTPDLTAL